MLSVFFPKRKRGIDRACREQTYLSRDGKGRHLMGGVVDTFRTGHERKRERERQREKRVRETDRQTDKQTDRED